MRILHIITKLNEMYGAQRHAVESVKDHLAHGHSCMVIAGEVGAASGMLESMGVTVKQASFLKNSYNPITGNKAVNEIVAMIEMYKPDLVISHSTIAGIVTRVACYRKKIPNIFTVQGWPFEIGTSWHQRLAGLVIEYLLKPFSDSYYCVSHYTAKYGIKTLGFKNTNRIYVGGNMHIDKVYTPAVPFRVHKNVLMVAGFRGQKDHISALKALEIIVKENKVPGLTLTFVGNGPKRNVIEAFIQERNLGNHINLAGETDNVDAFYDNADIIILPTYYEGLPLSLLEAIQKAKPVIATNVGGNNEVVIDNVNGNLLAVEDYTALATHIIDYYTNNKLQQLSVQSRKVYDDVHSYEKVSKQLNNIINKAVETSVFKK